jgi:hypothetical protein
MNNMPYDEHITEIEQKKITHMHSSMQIGATLYMLGNIDTAFSPLFAIQLAAFLMTLVRKNIIKANTWHIVYALSLWINAFLYLSPNLSYDFIGEEIMLYTIYTKLFFPLRLNKYIGWTIIYTLFTLKRIYAPLYIATYFSEYELYVRYGFTILFFCKECWKTKALFL